MSAWPGRTVTGERHPDASARRRPGWPDELHHFPRRAGRPNRLTPWLSSWFVTTVFTGRTFANGHHLGYSTQARVVSFIVLDMGLTICLRMLGGDQP